MKTEFNYTSPNGYKCKVRFRLFPKKDFAICVIKAPIVTGEYIYIKGVSICSYPDIWSDAEGRKWAMIDALKCLGKLKNKKELRRELWKSYCKFENKIRSSKNIVYEQTEEDKFYEYINSDDYYEWIQSLREQDSLMTIDGKDD
jgi:hypothetical protein